MIEFFYIYCLNKLISKVDNDDKRNVGREDPLFFFSFISFSYRKRYKQGIFSMVQYKSIMIIGRVKIYE